MPTPQRNGYDANEARVPVYILAGGRSRRFGSDKARVEIEGRPLILRLAESLANVADGVTVVARQAGAYADLGLRTIGDIVPDRGPLGGLLTAIIDRGHDGWVFVTACDWVGIEGSWVRRLLSERRAGGAVLFESGREQPLFGLYHTSVRAAVSEQIELGRLKMLHLLEEIDIVRVPAPDGFTRAVNLNQPVDRPES
jgi:molybdopterin-guanine dinucleotide biosynthesis protein A